MKRKSKWTALLLCTAIFCAALSGCSSDDAEGNKEIVTDDSSESETASDSDITIEKQVLVNQDGIKITAVKYVTDSIWGDGIKLQIKNDTKKDVGVGCSALIVNDYMISDLFAADVAAGKKSNKTLYLSSSELAAAGIENVGKIEIYFNVYDSDTYQNIFKTKRVKIKTSAFADMDTTPNDAGTELYNKGGIRIVGKAVDEDSFWGTAILLYCENNSGKDVGISVEDLSINGFMMDPLFSTTVYDGKKAIDDITIFSSDLEENGIESIEDVELQFKIYNANTYKTIAKSKSITFKAQ